MSCCNTVVGIGVGPGLVVSAGVACNALRNRSPAGIMSPGDRGRPSVMASFNFSSSRLPYAIAAGARCIARPASRASRRCNCVTICHHHADRTSDCTRAA